MVLTTKKKINFLLICFYFVFTFLVVLALCVYVLYKNMINSLNFNFNLIFFYFPKTLLNIVFSFFLRKVFFFYVTLCNVNYQTRAVQTKKRFRHKVLKKLLASITSWLILTIALFNKSICQIKKIFKKYIKFLVMLYLLMNLLEKL